MATLVNNDKTKYEIRRSHTEKAWKHFKS